ncbi:MAG: outer membrane beta-barrel family protein [Bacteroidales bacterium]
MKHTIAALFFLAGAIALQAQDITISGQVVDGQGGEPLEFATVALTRGEAGDLITGTVTDATGYFSMVGNLKGGYTIRVSYMGFSEEAVDLLIGELNRNFDLGRIVLSPLAEDLEEVSVSAQRSEVSAQMERKSFQMEDMVAQSGGSVLEAMKTLPGVTVDQDGKVILRGSDKVVVLIDGKQSSLTGFGNQKGLDNIPATNIERIEVINNPSARYDARGMAGIINIVYKKENQEGFNGDLGFAYGIGALTKPRADLPTDLGSFGPNSKYIPSVNMNYRKGKTNAFLLAETMLLHHLPNNEFTTRHYDDGRSTASQVPENRTQQHHIVNGGLEFNLPNRNTLVFSGIYDWERHVDTAQVPYIDLATNRRYRYITWREEEITGYMNVAADFNHKFVQPGHEFQARFQYTRGWEDETYYINDSSATRTGRDVTNILAVEHTTGLTVDYTKPLKAGRFEAGAKVQVRRLPVDYTVIPGENTIIYPGMGSWSDWGENFYALYGNYVLEKPVYDVEAGLRTEYTGVFYDMDPANIYYEENDAYDYFGLFPSVRLSFKPGQKHRFSAFYNRRIDRPGEPELRMFAKSDDHELLKVGNPYLRPQFTQSFELAYRLKWNSGSFYLAAYHRMITDPYMRVYTADTTHTTYDVIVKIYANTGSATNTGVELVFSQQVLDFWKLSANTNIYRNAIAAYEGELLFPYRHTFAVDPSTETTWDAKLNNQFAIHSNLEFQLTAVYLAPKNIPQGRQYARSTIDLGLALKVFDGKGTVTLSASDVLNTYGIRQEIRGEGFTATYENYYETQVFRLGMKYRF